MYLLSSRKLKKTISLWIFFGKKTALHVIKYANPVQRVWQKSHSDGPRKIIDCDLLTEFSQDTCPFKVVESDICANVFCERSLT